MNIYIPTCKRANLVRRITDRLPDAILVINNCNYSEYDHIDCEKIYLDISGDAAQCSNYAFCHIILNAPDDDDLLIIEDDVELCKNFEYELYNRAEAIESDGYKKYTINPLWTPARLTRYTPIKDERIHYGKYQFIDQNWVDTNLFIPQALVNEFKEWYKTPPAIAKKSNGIGRYHSKKMYSNGYHMFTCIPSLLGHGDHESIIYPEARKKIPLIAIL